MTGPAPFQFEDFVLDLATRELRRRSELVPLEPQVFDLLVYVIQNRDRVVSKDDLIEVVWGGRIVSESSLTTRINAARKALGDSGEEQRLIRTVARKGIRFIGAVTEGQAAVPAAASVAALTPERPALPLPDKPSIAVLPFQNMSGDPEQDYFADGMVEEIVTALSRFHWLFVIARNSTFTYKGRAVDVKQVARELGVRYVLEGSVRKAGQKVRITGQLIDASTGAHLWADKFDGDLADIFELQDRIAASVVGAIGSKVQSAEVERARRKPTASLDAYDLYLRALPHVESTTEAGAVEGLRLLKLAIEKDPTYARALAEAATCHDWRFICDWSKDREADGAEALRLARVALAYGQNDAEVLGVASYIVMRHGRDIDEALQRINRALTLNANSARIWLCSAHIRNEAGDPKAGLEHGERALRLGPFEPYGWLTLSSIGNSHLFLENFELAADWLRRSTKERPTYPANFSRLAASLAHLGRLDEAREALRRYRELRPLQTLSRMRTVPSFSSAQMKLLLDGLAKAGLPE